MTMRRQITDLHSEPIIDAEWEEVSTPAPQPKQKKNGFRDASFPVQLLAVCGGLFIIVILLSVMFAPAPAPEAIVPEDTTSPVVIQDGSEASAAAQAAQEAATDAKAAGLERTPIESINYAIFGEALTQPVAISDGPAASTSCDGKQILVFGNNSKMVWVDKNIEANIVAEGSYRVAGNRIELSNGRVIDAETGNKVEDLDDKALTIGRNNGAVLIDNHPFYVCTPPS
jgi:hypothetical protein